MSDYDDLKFKDAFNRAYKEKGAGKTFSWRGKSYLLEQAHTGSNQKKDQSFSDAFADALSVTGEGSTFKWRNKDYLVELAGSKKSTPNTKKVEEPLPSAEDVFVPVTQPSINFNQPVEAQATGVPVDVSNDKGYFKMYEPKQTQEEISKGLNLFMDSRAVATGVPTQTTQNDYFKPYQEGSYNPPVIETPKQVDFDTPSNAQATGKIPYVNTGESYFSWSKDPKEVSDSNNVLKQEAEAGNIEIEKKNGKEIVDQSGNFSYKIITDEYKKKFNDWIDGLNTPKAKQEDNSGNFVEDLRHFVGGVSDSVEKTYDDIGDVVTDYSEMLGNYVSRRIDSDVVKTKKLELAVPQQVIKAEKPQPVFKDQMDLTTVPVGDGFASSGIVNLRENKFAARNRDDMETVADGKGVAITTFRPFKRGKNDYRNFDYVLAQNKDGTAEIMKRDKVDDKVDLFTALDPMPFDKIKVAKGADGKEYVDVEKTEDFNGFIVSMGDYNSGIGIGRKQENGKAPLDGHASEYSQLLGGKVLMKTKDQQVLVAGSFKNMWDAYNTLKEKTKETPMVFKVDNGSFNTTYFKKENGITGKDLRKHQNRNNQGGHALILRNPDNKFQDGGKNNFDLIRTDNTLKGQGFFGTIKTDDGYDMTERSETSEWDGKEHLYPTLAPGLTSSQLKYLQGIRHNEKGQDENMNKAISDNALRYAYLREDQGQPFFATKEEEGMLPPPIQNYAYGGQLPVSSNGLYDYPNQKVIVPTQSGNITMEGIDYPVMGRSLETGEEQMMQPNGYYNFKNTKHVLEIPNKKK